MLINTGQFCTASTKEIHYFDDAVHYNRGAAYYQSQFDHECGKAFTVDATPNYFDSAGGRSVQRMVIDYPAEDWAKKKFLLILREPAYRLHSLYTHLSSGCIDYMKVSYYVSSFYH